MYYYVYYVSLKPPKFWFQKHIGAREFWMVTVTLKKTVFVISQSRARGVSINQTFWFTVARAGHPVWLMSKALDYNETDLMSTQQLLGGLNKIIQVNDLSLCLFMGHIS